MELVKGAPKPALAANHWLIIVPEADRGQCEDRQYSRNVVFLLGLAPASPLGQPDNPCSGLQRWALTDAHSFFHSSPALRISCPCLNPLLQD